VLAKVNGDEITVHQVNDRLSQLGVQPGLDARAAQKQILEALVDEQLLMQKAIADKLDRDPSALQAIERAKRQILVQAEIERTGGKIDIGPEEAAKFYAANRNLFEKRRIYTFHQFLLEVPKVDASVKSKLDNAKTAAEVASVLRAAGMPFRDRTEVQAAEGLPMEVLDRAARMSRGDILVFNEAGRAVLMQLADSILVPIDLKQANPAIEGYLANVKKKEIAVSLLKDLRQTAEIEYVGESVDGSPAPAAAAEPPATGTAPKSDDFIHKGISGLKK
jgi:EpsD family peptidyl-prolyl cis-trans isomerase